MNTTEQNLRRIPFPALSAGRSFVEQMNVSLRARIDELMGGMIPKENTEFFYHGRTFVYRQEDLSSHAGTMENHSVGQEMDLESIISGDLKALPHFLETIAINFVRQQKQLLFRNNKLTSSSKPSSISLMNCCPDSYPHV
jgi:hypothetical protein